ncbi:MAG: ubiquinone/menaquinone biosynthesis methyltransferase [Candidatus Eisenbacteria bacterium]
MTGERARAPGRGAPDPDGGGILARGEQAVEEQRSAVRGMFDRVSCRYDLLNRLLSFGLDARWRREAIRRAGIGPGDRFLDVACGTGDLGLEAARAAERVGVLGVDFSQPMLRRAGLKGTRNRRPRPLRLAAGAAEQLPVRGGAFAAAGIAFGIRNVPDRGAALREMARAVRPGGRVVVLEFTTSGSGAVERAVDFYLRRVLPRIGGLLSSGGAYRYLAASMGAFPPPDAFAREMEDAGLEAVRYRRLSPAPTWLYVGTRPL